MLKLSCEQAKYVFICRLATKLHSTFELRTMARPIHISLAGNFRIRSLTVYYSLCHNCACSKATTAEGAYIG